LKRPLDYEDEIAVPIKTIWIHPIRGILAKPVKEAYICPYGMKYDRELALIDIETNSPLTSTSWIKAAFITQELIYEPKPLLRLTTSSPDLLKSRNLPISLDIYLTDDLPSINHRKYRNCERTYGGYEYPEDVNNWISTAIRKPVVLIHSRLTRLNLIRKQYAILKREND
jgi:hypothetical protein